MRISAVVAAGGVGARVASAVPKQFLELAGKPILVRTLEALAALDDLLEIVVALPARNLRAARGLVEQERWSVPILCVAGGATRQASVQRAVRRTRSEADLILVHDAVRPLCDRPTMERVVEAAWRTGAAVPALPATDTIQRVSARGRICETPPRDELYAIQTPQGFRAALLRRALERAERAGFLGTDESSVVRWAGHPVVAVEGSPSNIKITRPIDLALAELHLTGGRREARVGHGVDYHRLVEGRKLILGGVEVPFERGLEGHSDADVLSHAIADALLGAAAAGDIGRHFPDTDAAHRGRSSLEFLAEIQRKLAAAGWRIANVDATIVAERPRLAPFTGAMRDRLAGALGMRLEQVNVKATSTERMNAEGRGEGMAAQAVALLERVESS